MTETKIVFHPRRKLSEKQAAVQQPPLRKPSWLRVRIAASPEVGRLRQLLREHQLHTVCEEAACPNLAECFSGGTATFMILGKTCTRHCPFCDVANGKPTAVNTDEPELLAETVALLRLNYVVITSVNRDDLADGGAEHFANCIKAVRKSNPQVRVEILVPDFRRCLNTALGMLGKEPPDVLNHNVETVPRLYRTVRPGARYTLSLKLLEQFAERHPGIPTKSGMMLGLGETMGEIKEVLQDLRAYGCSMLTLGQYLQPSSYHLAVERYVLPEEFRDLKCYAETLGFKEVASGPLVRSSYHAEQQARFIVDESAAANPC